MTTGKAIVIGSIVVGACILASTGYVYLRDRAAAEAARQERERAAKAEADAIKLTRGKAAWDESKKYMETMLGLWINENNGTLNQEAMAQKTMKCFQFLSIKSYANNDVTWDNPKTVTVHGIAVAMTFNGRHVSDPRAFYSWSSKYVWLDEGKWGQGPAKKAWHFESISDPGSLILDDINLAPLHAAPCGVN